MNNYQTKLHQLDHELLLKELHLQVEEIDQIIAQLKNKQVLNLAPSRLGFYPDEIEDLSFKLNFTKQKKLLLANNLLNNFRSFISRNFGLWSLANHQTAMQIKNDFHCHTGLEVMAGNGYWSKALNEVGVKMIATDSFSWAKSSSTGSRPFYSTKAYEAADAIKKFVEVDLLICCWAPNFGQGDSEILNAYRKYCAPTTKLLFIGEKNGATNTPKFWQEAIEVKSPALKEINRSFTSFDFIEERFYEIK